MKALPAPSEGDADTPPLRSPVRRKRHHLSRDLIIAEAVAMLKEGDLKALTLRGLAKRLGVGAMSLYTHFASRDALINAVADHLFALFEPPDPAAPWQEYVRNWLWATYAHFARYPVAPKIISFDGQVCPAWLKTWLPIATKLKENGLSGRDLAFAMDWFSTAAMSFIHAQMDARTTRQATALTFVAELQPADQRLSVELWSEFPELENARTLAFGFELYVQGLETLIRNAGQASSAAA